MYNDFVYRHDIGEIYIECLYEYFASNLLFTQVALVSVHTLHIVTATEINIEQCR
mgnify:CR=1 FL=1